MKKIIKSNKSTSVLIISILFMFAIALTSCSKEEPIVNLNTAEKDLSLGLITITGEDTGAATKTTLDGLQTKWIAGIDKVGIYSPEARTTSSGSAGCK